MEHLQQSFVDNDVCRAAMYQDNRNLTTQVNPTNHIFEELD